MAKRCLVATIWMLTAFFAVAAQDSPYEKVLAQVVDSFEKIGATLKTINDEDSAKTSRPELRKAANVFLKVRADATKMQPPEKDEKLRLEKRFKPKLEAAMKQMFIEIQRVQVIAGGKEALTEIADVLKKEAKK